MAEKYDVVPSYIYAIINSGNTNKSGMSQSSSYKQGSGYGRKMISEVFKENNLSWEEGVELLKKSSIIVTEDMKLKDIATENKKIPVDIINALK